MPTNPNPNNDRKDQPPDFYPGDVIRKKGDTPRAVERVVWRTTGGGHGNNTGPRWQLQVRYSGITSYIRADKAILVRRGPNAPKVEEAS